MANYNIREIALDTLVEILEHGEFSHIYLKQVLDKYAYFEKNERSFITRLVNGTVERKLELDYYIDHYSKTKVKKMKPLIRTIMRMGTFEIYYMDSVPDSATCNEYVKLAKKRGFTGLSGFVNGVLRSIARDKGKVELPDISTKYSIPQWLIEMWEEDYGKEEAAEIAAGFFEDQRLCIRANISMNSAEELIDILSKEKVKAEKAEGLVSGLFISDYDSIDKIKAFKEGRFYVQDYSSQLVAQWADIKPDYQILDVCAAPGGKASHAAELACDGMVIARDLTEAKVAIINENIARIGIKNIRAEVGDATVSDAASIEKFDLVIADLPCSGLGIIRKKPDIKYNQTLESLKELEALQAKILEVVNAYVKPGGTLVYSTCTINKGENENQIENFLSSHSDFKMEKKEQLFATKEHDGFFICVMKKK